MTSEEKTLDSVQGETTAVSPDAAGVKDSDSSFPLRDDEAAEPLAVPPSFAESPPGSAQNSLHPNRTCGAEADSTPAPPQETEGAYPSAESTCSGQTPAENRPACEESASPGGPSGNEPCRPEQYLGILLRKTVFFLPGGAMPLNVGSKVIVALEQGTAIGEVTSIISDASFFPARTPEEDGPVSIIGLATAEDIARNVENKTLEAEAGTFCKNCIQQRRLDMKLVDVEVLHDRGKIIFYFTAPTRIDFRELVKDLVRHYRTRIELRQIGVRHEVQMIGSLGNCGRVCCCGHHLRKFAPVTIKMAKEQNLFLNPAKLSGICGRLLCCLSFEQGNYEEFNRRCPKLGKRYSLVDHGVVKVVRANMFARKVTVLTDAGSELEFSLEEWEDMASQRAEVPGPEQPRQTAHKDKGHEAPGKGPASAVESRGASRDRSGRKQGSDVYKPGPSDTREALDSGRRQRPKAPHEKGPSRQAHKGRPTEK